MSETRFFKSLDLPVEKRKYLEIESANQPKMPEWTFWTTDDSDEENEEPGSGPVFQIEDGWVQASRELAAKQFGFPKGHPIVEHAYAVDPHDDQRYIPLDQYERVLFESKALELSQILIALGASRIQVNHKQGSGASSSVRAEADYSGATGPMGGNASLSRKSDRTDRMFFGGEFDPQRAPTLPAGLKWLDSEPIWQAVVDRRLNHRMTKFQIALSHDSTSSTSMQIGFRVPFLCAAVNSEFDRFESTLWEFEGEFADLDALPAVSAR